MNDLHLRFRPSTWEGVVGHKKIVASIRHAVKTSTGHSFLLTGPSGVGKTTLARIIASEVGCTPQNLREIDAATNSGVDAMRAITETLQYVSLGASPTKVLIVDEAHSLSKAAWQSLLKGVEEPPAHVYWIFCTTEGHKVPETIRTRCLAYELASLKSDDLYDLLDTVLEELELTLPDRVDAVLVKAAQGSPRRLLTCLAKCIDCEDYKGALEVLQSVDSDEGEAVELARLLVKGTTWEKAAATIKKLADQNPESIRLVVVNYVSKVLLGTKGDKQAAALLTILDAFGRPYIQAEGLAPLFLSVGQVVFG